MIHTIDLHFQGISSNIAAFLMETSAGPILIETGPHSTLPALLKGIEEAGFKASDIQHVFLSHIHFDHAGAAWWFARQGATIYVHPKGYPHLLSPERLMSSAKKIYQDKMDELWGEMHSIPENQLVAVAHEQSIDLGGIPMTSWHTPGHAVHHIAWQYGDDLFTGDVAGVSINKGIVIPPCPPPDINIEDWQASIQFIKQLDVKRFYLTHFGAVDNLVPHLESLEKRLIDWAAWMKSHYENNTSKEELVVLFGQKVRGELEASGLSVEEIQKYEAANPNWMSIAGLLRYWKVKGRS